jgi:hypothetical protein
LRDFGRNPSPLSGDAADYAAVALQAYASPLKLNRELRERKSAKGNRLSFVLFLFA